MVAGKRSTGSAGGSGAGGGAAMRPGPSHPCGWRHGGGVGRGGGPRADRGPPGGGGRAATVAQVRACAPPVAVAGGSRGLLVVEVEDRVREVDESDPLPVVVDGGPYRVGGAERGVGGVVAGGGGDGDDGGFFGQPGPQVAFPGGAVQPEQHRPGTADLSRPVGGARQLVDP